MKASVCAGLQAKVYPLGAISAEKNRLQGTTKSSQAHEEPEQEEIAHPTHIKSKSIDAFSDLDQLSSRRALKSIRKVASVVNKSMGVSTESRAQTRACTR